MRWGRWERWRLPVEVGAAPEGQLSQRARTKPRFRRESDAGGRLSSVIPSGAPIPAPFPRRRACLVRNAVGNLPSGAVSSPEGASPQPRRTRTSFRRLSLAEGLALAETCNEVSPLRHPGTRPSEPLRAPPRKRLGVSRKVPQLSIELVAQEPPLLRGRKGVGKVALLHKAIERHLKSVAEKVLGI